jgi:DNA ligase D-like protein (predicted 3'-phosphoesterase)
MGSEDKLTEYREKRDFSKTPEPQGGEKQPGDEPIFVVQKHDASNLHYDFRLEIDGVLKSWAVPKGPSVNPSVKRLAVPTEDHALDYADFEGVIPEGEYGAGTVMVWDIGTYRNKRKEKSDDQATMTESWEDGKVEVELHGKKLRGGFALVRTGKKEDSRWLLIKMDDKHADRDTNILEAKPESAKSNRTLEEIQKDG